MRRVLVLASITVLTLVGLTASAAASVAGGSRSAGAKLPGGGELLFTRTTFPDVQTIYATTGRAERQLTAPGASCCLVRVSPDHRRILVMPGSEDIPLPITGATINLTGGNFTRIKLTDPTLNLVPQAWSPTGSRIAFEGWDGADPSRAGIYTARVSDGGGLTRVTKRPDGLHDVPLDYSPDGRRLVFYREVRPDPDDPDLGRSLWVAGVDGSHAHEITKGAVRPNWWARWSPDGSRILFAAERLSPSGGVWTIRPDGSHLNQIFHGRADRFPYQPAWSPDGRWIVFALNPTNNVFMHPDNTLYVMRADGSALTLISNSHDFKSQPEWFATHCSKGPRP